MCWAINKFAGHKLTQLEAKIEMSWLRWLFTRHSDGKEQQSNTLRSLNEPWLWMLMSKDLERFNARGVKQFSENLIIAHESFYEKHQKHLGL